MKRYVIIVAGGKGLRMGGEMPKQFMPLANRPVLMRTLEAFHACDPSIRLILVLPAEHQEYWKCLCSQYRFTLPHTLVNGGETRFHSVRNGLELVPAQDTLVGVHDGVRPFVSEQVITRCFSLAAEKHAVVPVIDMVDTVRHITGPETSETVARDSYKLVQTPQVFEAGLLKRAYAKPYSSLFTDDASVVEALGHPVFLTEGNRENIKLTTPFDLKVAEALL